MNKILSLNLNGIGNVGAFEENVSGVKHYVHSCCLFFLKNTLRDYYKDMNSPLKGEQIRARLINDII